MRDALDGIRQRMGKVVHRIDAPGISRTMMMGVGDAVDDRIAHDHIRRSHVDLRAQYLLSIGEFASLHTGKQIKVLLDTAVAVRAFLARLRQRAAVLLDLLSREVIHISQALLDELDRIVIELIEVVRGIIHAVLPREAEPMDVLLDGVDVLRILLRRIRIVEAQVAKAMIVLSQAEVQANGLCVTNMEIAIRLRWKARMNALRVFAILQVILNRILNKIRSDCRILCHVILSFIHPHGL